MSSFYGQGTLFPVRMRLTDNTALPPIAGEGLPKNRAAENSVFRPNYLVTRIRTSTALTPLPFS